eukprot:2507420-Alexandrium_andersonii.AAC.1
MVVPPPAPPLLISPLPAHSLQPFEPSVGRAVAAGLRGTSLEGSSRDCDSDAMPGPKGPLGGYKPPAKAKSPAKAKAMPKR